jgi:hypothetical protein
MTHEERMEKALAELESCSKPNYAALAKKYELERSTLSRHARGKTTSREEFQSEKHQCLTNAQERVLINQINRLTDQGIPPTSQMVKNFAEEIIGHSVEKNWVGQFTTYYQRELKSLYLCNIDNLCMKGEYASIYKLFFDLVKCLLHCFLILVKDVLANYWFYYSLSKQSNNIILGQKTYTIEMKRGS